MNDPPPNNSPPSDTEPLANPTTGIYRSVKTIELAHDTILQLSDDNICLFLETAKQSKRNAEVIIL